MVCNRWLRTPHTMLQRLWTPAGAYPWRREAPYTSHAVSSRYHQDAYIALSIKPVGPQAAVRGSADGNSSRAAGVAAGVHTASISRPPTRADPPRAKDIGRERTEPLMTVKIGSLFTCTLITGLRRLQRHRGCTTGGGARGHLPVFPLPRGVGQSSRRNCSWHRSIGGKCLELGGV